MFVCNKFSETHEPIDNAFVIRVEQMRPVAMNTHTGFVNLIMCVAGDMRPAVNYIDREAGLCQLACISRARKTGAHYEDSRVHGSAARLMLAWNRRGVCENTDQCQPPRPRSRLDSVN